MELRSKCCCISHHASYCSPSSLQEPLQVPMLQQVQEQFLPFSRHPFKLCMEVIPTYPRLIEPHIYDYLCLHTPTVIYTDCIYHVYRVYFLCHHAYSDLDCYVVYNADHTHYIISVHTVHVNIHLPVHAAYTVHIHILYILYDIFIYCIYPMAYSNLYLCTYSALHFCTLVRCLTACRRFFNENKVGSNLI